MWTLIRTLSLWLVIGGVVLVLGARGIGALLPYGDHLWFNRVQNGVVSTAVVDLQRRLLVQVPGAVPRGCAIYLGPRSAGPPPETFPRTLRGTLSVSPDRQWVTLSSFEANQLTLYDARGGAHWALPGEYRVQVWSQDSRGALVIDYQPPTRYLHLRLEDGQRTVVMPVMLPGGGSSDDQIETFAPDAGWLVFRSNRASPGQSNDLYLLDMHSGSIDRLTALGARIMTVMWCAG